MSEILVSHITYILNCATNAYRAGEDWQQYNDKLKPMGYELKEHQGKLFLTDLFQENRYARR